MLDSLFWMLEQVRTKILEGFIIPDLDISYWEFCIYSAIVGVVVTVLINGVKVSGSAQNYSVREGKYHETLRQRERVKADERERIKNKGSSLGSGHDFDAIDNAINNK